MTVKTKSNVPLFARFSIQLFIMLLLAFVPALVLIVHTNIKERQGKKQNTRDKIVATAELAASRLENFVRNAEQLLATLSQIPFLVENSDRVFSQVHFSNLRILAPEYLDIGLVEPDGTLFCSTVITNRAPNFSGWSCFKRAMERQGFAIGSFGTNGTTSQPTLDFCYPIFDDGGKIKRILYASLDMARLRKAADQIVLPAEANVTVFDDGGSVLARTPDSVSQPWIGKAMVGDPFVQHLLNQGGVFEMPGLDGTQKLFAASTISDNFKKRLWVSVGIPSKTLFAGANEDLLKSILIVGLIVLLAFVVAYVYAEHFFLRPLYSLIAEARLLGTRKWVARSQPLTGKGELSELSRTFNEMATTLEKHRSDIEATNAALEQRVRDRTVELEQAGRELESFSYSVSHDLRAPLRHIAGFIDLLRDELGDNVSPKSHRFTNIIADSAKQMGQLIDELLVFSKMGRVEMQKTIINTSDILEEAITSVEPEVKGRNIIWEKSPLPKLQADPAMLRQVFINLLSNSIKYSQPRDPARIQIGHEEKDGQTIIFVRDNGVGFDMKFANKLFGVFQRLHQADEFEGTGIGLANVRRIIQRHGGQTWAEGKVGEGATIYFSLPKLSNQ